MFQNLGQRLNKVFAQLRHRGVLSEEDVSLSLREIRLALLEADVALPVVKHFIEEVRLQATGQAVIKSVTPGQLVVKIVHDHLKELLGKETAPLNLQGLPPLVLLMVGLQGSGKTTTTAKLARWLQHKLHKRVLMASLDLGRPAAQEQLMILGQQIGVPTLPHQPGDTPLRVAARAQTEAKHYDVLLLDSAGRLHIDNALMEELTLIKSQTKPLETLLVADSLMGQDALTTAKNFHEHVKLTGIILTRVDGDARGGAALSMLTVTGQPIKFVGVGEKLDQLEPFDPQRMADRILGMGDIVGLVEKAYENAEEETAAKAALKLAKGKFDLVDMAGHLEQMLKMGGINKLVGMLPGFNNFKLPAKEALDDRVIHRQIAIIRSMTMQERYNPKLINGSRRRRIAKGAGVDVPAVNKTLKQFEVMQTVVKKLGRLQGKGMFRQISNLKNLLKG